MSIQQTAKRPKIKMTGRKHSKFEPMDCESLEDYCKRYSYIAQSVASAYASKYGRYVDYEDLLAQANLLLVEACTKPDYLSRSERTQNIAYFIDSGLYKYCTKECVNVRVKELEADGVKQKHAASVCIGTSCRELMSALSIQDKRTQRIMYLYFYEGLTLSEIGNMFCISDGRVSQIVHRSLRRLRAYDWLNGDILTECMQLFNRG